MQGERSTPRVNLEISRSGNTANKNRSVHDTSPPASRLAPFLAASVSHPIPAIQRNTIRELKMNARPLSRDQGYPLRLIVPGWYGMTQIKWLNRIVVLDRRYEARHMARNYHSIRGVADDLVLETSISRTRLKSVVARAEPAGTGVSLSGAAWGGSHPIERVEVRIDAEPWREAIVSKTGDLYVWSLWNCS
jgi:DMSO/TMAO reductase YedYZ molybdopterin-dependent catalytic subunit